jgi:hypothetical protein
MGDGDAADAGDLGGPDFAPAIPAVESSAVAAPPTNRAAIVLGPGYSGHVTLPRASHRVQPPPPAEGGDLGGGAEADPPPAHHDRGRAAT